MEKTVNQTEIAALETLVRGSTEPTTIDLETPDGGRAQMLCIPNGNGYTLHNLSSLVDPFRSAPVRRKGTIKLFDLDSFIAMTTRFSDSDSVVFASDAKPPTFVSVLDYHRIGAEGGPRFGEHRATFTPALSPEWLAWTGINKKLLSQSDFADFIDAHIADLYDLPAASEDGGPGKPPALVAEFIKATGAKCAAKVDIIGVSQEFSIRSEATIKGVKRLSTGETQVSYEETTKAGDGGDLNAPAAFIIAIPVVKFGPLIAIPVRLRFKKVDQSIRWHIEMFESDRAFEAEIADMIERVGLPPIPGDSSADARKKAGTGLPVYRGSPE